MAVISNIVDGITDSVGVDFNEFVEANLQMVIHTLQLINDFDLEVLVHSSIFTLWKISDEAQEDHIQMWKEFIFTTITTANEQYMGDISQVFLNGVPQQSEEVDESEVTDNFISDEVYGDVNPDDLELLKTCFSL